MTKVTSKPVRAESQAFGGDEEELIKYLAKAAQGRYWVHADHLTRLAEKYNLVLERDGVQYMSLPSEVTYPHRFKNIHEFLRRAREAGLSSSKPR